MKLIRRAAWGARYGRGGTNITPSQGGVTVHYEGGGRLTGRPHSACAARVRGIEQFHVNTRGWAGIAYSYLVCEHGYVFEGRGLGHRTAANGTTDGNNRYYAVCALIGDSDPTSDLLLTGIRDAIDYMRAHGAGPRVVGHRDHLSTSCPGTRLYAWVQKGAPRPIREDDMPLSDNDLDAIYEAMWERDAIPSPAPNPANPKQSAANILRTAAKNATDAEEVARQVLARQEVIEEKLDQLLAQNKPTP